MPPPRLRLYQAMPATPAKKHFGRSPIGCRRYTRDIRLHALAAARRAADDDIHSQRASTFFLRFFARARDTPVIHAYTSTGRAMKNAATSQRRLPPIIIYIAEVIAHHTTLISSGRGREITIQDAYTAI